MGAIQKASLNGTSEKRVFFKTKAHALLVLALLLPGAGCAELFNGITYYDPTTYKSLTDAKPEVLMLYDTFGSDSVDPAGVSAVRLELARAYEYEKGKGEKNKETYEQIQKIQNMFERHQSDRIQNGKWNKDYLEDKKQNIAQAFDIAIRTERLKNKNE